MAEAKSRIDKNVIVPLVNSGSVSQYSAEPEYSGDSVIPTRINIRAWNPREFKTKINIWGEALKQNK